MTRKLFKVTLRGMHGDWANVSHGIAYVVAPDPTSAYMVVKKYVDDNDLGFPHDRELSKIELLAECQDYPDCNVRLFIAEDDNE